MENGVWRTISCRKVFIKNGQSLSDAIKESGKFKEETIYALKDSDISLSDNFKSSIDSKVQENVIKYTQEFAKQYDDILLNDKIVWKTFVRSNNEVANSNFNLSPNYFNDYENAKTFIRNKMNNGEYVKCDDEFKYIVAHEVGHNISTGLYNRLNSDKLRTVKDYENWNNKFMKRVEER